MQCQPDQHGTRHSRVMGTVARGLDVYGEDPITIPNDLRSALQRTIEVVESGEPALVDVFTQPR